jgi:predicted MFS family arabinose efflux permease
LTPLGTLERLGRLSHQRPHHRRTFAAFSYCTPILIHEVGIAPSQVAPLLALYGVANLLGNMFVGRVADLHTLPVLGWGLALLGAGMALLGLLSLARPFARRRVARACV